MPTPDSPRMPNGYSLDETELGRRIAAAVISTQQDEPYEKIFRELNPADVGHEWIEIGKLLKEGMTTRVRMQLTEQSYRHQYHNY